MQNNYRPALELAQRNLHALDPKSVAARSGAELIDGEGGKEFRLRLVGRDYRVPLAEAVVYDLATGASAGVPATLVALHYLATAEGGPVRHEWVPFRILPGGNVYEAAFRKQAIEPLVAAFGGDPEGLSVAAEALGGVRATMGDLSYVFQALPHLPMACVLWLGDEEQGAEVSLLYDAVAPSLIHTEDLASLGRQLAFGLIKAAGRKP